MYELSSVRWKWAQLLTSNFCLNFRDKVQLPEVADVAVKFGSGQKKALNSQAFRLFHLFLERTQFYY